MWWCLRCGGIERVGESEFGGDGQLPICSSVFAVVAGYVVAACHLESPFCLCPADFSNESEATPALIPPHQPPAPRTKRCRNEKDPPHHAFFSKNSLASFTLVARYGLPPRSGWLSSISVRCALRTFSLLRLLSLYTGQSSQHPILSRPPLTPPKYHKQQPRQMGGKEEEEEEEETKRTSTTRSATPRACSCAARSRPCKRPCRGRPRRRASGARLLGRLCPVVGRRGG